jgi:hypothetical protein
MHSHQKRQRVVLIALGLCAVASCEQWTPFETTSPPLFEDIYVVALAWPDTIRPGETGTAQIELRTLDDRPLLPTTVSWTSDDVRVAELYPTRVPEAKRVFAAGLGRTMIIVRASYRPRGGNTPLVADLQREVVVVP